MNAWELLWSKVKGIKISSDGITLETDTLTEQDKEELSHLRMSTVTGQIFDEREVAIN